VYLFLSPTTLKQSGHNSSSFDTTSRGTHEGRNVFFGFLESDFCVAIFFFPILFLLIDDYLY